MSTARKANRRTGVGESVRASAFGARLVSSERSAEVRKSRSNSKGENTSLNLRIMSLLLFRQRLQGKVELELEILLSENASQVGLGHAGPFALPLPK